MRNLSSYTAAALCTAALGLGLTGCGSESGPGGGSGTSSPPTTTPPPTLPTATESTPAGSALPLTVSRTGGVAGFDDQVLIGTDGVATVSSRTKGTVRCKLDPSLLTSLTTAAQQVDWAGLDAKKPTTKYPDDMIVAVTAHGKTARLEHPRVQPLVAPVSKLLTEATIPPGKLCKQL